MRPPDAYDEEFWSHYLAARHTPCPACGYDLRGGRSAACPECGHITSLSELRRCADPSEEGWYVVGGWGLTTAALAGLAPAGVAVCFGVVVLLNGERLGAVSGGVMLLVGLLVIATPLLAARWWERRAGHLRAKSGALRIALVLVWWTLALLNLGLSLMVISALAVELARMVQRV